MVPTLIHENESCVIGNSNSQQNLQDAFKDGTREGKCNKLRSCQKIQEHIQNIAL